MCGNWPTFGQSNSQTAMPPRYTAHYDRGNAPEEVTMGFTSQHDEPCGLVAILDVLSPFPLPCYINFWEVLIYIYIQYIYIQYIYISMTSDDIIVCFQRVFLVIVDLGACIAWEVYVQWQGFQLSKQRQLDVLDLGGQCDDNVIIRQESLLAEQVRDGSRASVGLESLNTLSRKPIIRDLSDIDYL